MAVIKRPRGRSEDLRWSLLEPVNMKWLVQSWHLNWHLQPLAPPASTTPQLGPSAPKRPKFSEPAPQQKRMPVGYHVGSAIMASQARAKAAQRRAAEASSSSTGQPGDVLVPTTVVPKLGMSQVPPGVGIAGTGDRARVPTPIPPQAPPARMSPIREAPASPIAQDVESSPAPSPVDAPALEVPPADPPTPEIEPPAAEAATAGTGDRAGGSGEAAQRVVYLAEDEAEELASLGEIASEEHSLAGMTHEERVALANRRN